MKKMKFTLRILLFLIAGFTVHSALYAQAVIVNVPADFPSVREAIQGHEATASQITVNIAEGILEETYHQFWAWNADLEIIVQGAGANKTFIQPLGVTEMPDLQNDSANHWWQVNQTNAPEHNGSISFKDLTFRYWGRAGTRSIMLLQKHANATKFIGMNVTFENVVFDSNIGRTLIQASDSHGLHFDNCLFINNVTAFDLGGVGGNLPAQPFGLLSPRNQRAESGFTNSIKNCTFFGNTAYRNTVTAHRGRLIEFWGWAGRESELIMSNIVAVENKLAGTPVEGVHPLVSFDIQGTNLGTKLTVEKFTSIGNIRVDEELDFDIVIAGNWEHPNLVFEEDQNIVQRVGKQVITAVVPDPTKPDSTINVTTYELVDDWWFTKQYPFYSYTHPDINFTMDGDLPKLTEDVSGIGHVEFSGDGGDPEVLVSVDKVETNPLKFFTYNGMVVIEGLQVKDLIHLYDITGSLVKVVVPRGADRVEIAMPKGIYIIQSLARSNEKAQKVVVH